MKLVFYILILGLFLIELANQIYIHSLVRNLFSRVYSETKKLWFSKKIAWLKANAEDFERADQDLVQKILFHRKLSIYLIIALFVVFYGSLMLGINK